MRSSIPARTPSSKSLSLAATPVLPAPQDPLIQAPTPRKPIAPDFKEGPRWPVSPRLKSPPPQLVKPGFPSRLSEQDPPTLNLQRPTPSPGPGSAESIHATNSESDTEDSQLHSGLRTPARGALETVQEVSLPNSPTPTSDAVLLAQVTEKLGNQSDSALNDGRTLGARPNMLTQDSGSDTTNLRPERRPSSVPPPPLVTRQSSAMSMSSKQLKSKQEGPTQAMTVETETVASIPQVALTTNIKAEGPNGTLRAKPSTETIRPRKEKKKTSRKPTAVNTGNGENPHLPTSYAQPKLRHHQSTRSLSVASDNGLLPTSPCGRDPQGDDARSPRPGRRGSRTQSIGFHPMSNLLTRSRPASSKADIFEAKIANAVDEANTSDSEETFVYDSNPPDVGDRSGRRFHSRTPSATSMVSQADRQHTRSIYGVMEAGPTHGPKRGMKFVNTLNSNGSDCLNPEDDSKGIDRNVGGSTRGTARQHHHIGRWGRQPHNHTSLFAEDSPFPNAARSKLNGPQSRNSSNPPSPRQFGGLSHKRSNIQMSNYPDMDETTGADDERTPLIGSSRSVRSGRNRRGPHNLRQAESQSFNRRPSYLNRFAACLVLTMMFLLVITGAIGFMFATSQPMSDIEIVSIKNVVTSDQVLMFDLTVRAHNPNIVVVTIDQANLEIFAKSEHGGTDSDWRVPKDSDSLHILDDPVSDPPLDDDDSKPNVLLGRITEFDSPLTFEGSLFHKGSSTSTGEVQLAYPGNGTVGGPERWERIYQDEFDLIVKGVVKYNLPLSARVRSATVSARTTIKPNSANDPSINTTLIT